jgi:peptidoglycan/xylan/chitin deacetylase (PgdA/CDA1 family)
MYHYISTVPAHDPDPMERKSLSVSPQIFGQQLDYLKAQNFHSITFNQLMANLYYNIILPPSPVILTFDDGYDDAYSAAYPILKAHGYSGMFYIISGKVGWKGQASWDQLREMLDNGMQMGSHTIHHVDMGSVYQASKLQAQQEVQISQQTLQQNLGIVIQHFCYPNGGPFKGNNRQLQQKVVSLLAANGYIDATTDPGPTGIIQDNLQPFALLRLRIDGRSSMQFFEHTM